MDFDVPTDLINQSQIGFREGAGLSSFNPNGTTLPSLPTIEASISTLDPSPPYLRCKFCQAKLLRGLQSLICIYCGEYQKKDLHPDPISFNSTNGYSWLLRSLNLNGSERVGSLAEGSGFHGGQSPADDLVTISELLDLQISWRDQPKKPEISFNDKTSELPSPLNLGTANLDNFFTERIASDATEEQQVSSKHGQNQAFGDQENVNLFPNAFPPETPVTSSIDDSSDWNAEFQFADSKVENEIPKPVDHIVAPEPDLSAHMDVFFGQMESSSNKKPNEDKDWVQDDLFANMGPTTFQQSEQLESVVQQKDGLSLSGQLNDQSSKDVDQDWFSDGNWQKSSVEKHDNSQDKDNPNVSSTEDWFENANWQKSSGDKKDDDLFDFKPEIDAASSPSLVNDLKVDSKSSDFDNSKKQDLEAVDWFQDSQWSTGASNVTTNMEVKKDDEFDDWNDFTSSTGNQDSLQDSWKQSGTQDSFQDSWKQSRIENTDGSKKIQEINLFESTDDSQEMDLFSGFKNPNDAQVDMFSEASTSNRNVNVEGGLTQNTPNAITSQENDVQMLLSQMHDLSFMLKSELSIPSKPTDDNGSSHS